MSKKKKDQNSTLKPMEEMTDAEFIANAKLLSSPYYRSYVVSSCRYGVPEENEDMSKEKSKNKKNKKEKAEKLYEKKRIIPLILVALLMLLSLLLIFIGFTEEHTVSKDVALFTIPERVLQDDGEVTEQFTAFTEADPIVAIFNLIGAKGKKSNYYELFMESNFSGEKAMTKLALLLVPIASLLTMIFAVIGLVKAVIAIFARQQEDGFYKKYKFGFISFCMFLCSLLYGIGGLYVSGLKLPAISEYLAMTSNVIRAGVGFYLTLVISFVCFVLSFFTYKRYKE